MIIVISFTISLVKASPPSVELRSDLTVLNNGQISSVSANFPQTASGDLYLATVLNGTLQFFGERGRNLSPVITPFQSLRDFSGILPLFEIQGSQIEPGRYPLYLVLNAPNKDPLDPSNWLSSLHRLNFHISMPVNLSRDYNADGYPDDDANHDGFHDADHDYDGMIDDSALPGPVPGHCSNSSILDGPALYQQHSCASGACHGNDPKLNKNGVLRGVTVNEIRNAGFRNQESMGFVVSMTDAELQAVANYLKLFDSVELHWEW